MKTKTIPAGALALALLTLLALLAAGAPAHAQQPQPQSQPQSNHKAGLVVQFGGGRIYAACIDLGNDGQATGEELLESTYMNLTADYDATLGAGVCSIDGEGCDFPNQDCFCKCTLRAGEPCSYWAYHHLEGGEWVYAQEGASSHIVRHGDVDGWAWGSGTTDSGAEPPLRTFEDLCGETAKTELPIFLPLILGGRF